MTVYYSTAVRRPDDFGWGYAAVHAMLRAVGRLARLTVTVVRDVLLAATIAAVSFLFVTAVFGAVSWSR